VREVTIYIHSKLTGWLWTCFLCNCVWSAEVFSLCAPSFQATWYYLSTTWYFTSNLSPKCHTPSLSPSYVIIIIKTFRFSGIIYPCSFIPRESFWGHALGSLIGENEKQTWEQCSKYHSFHSIWLFEYQHQSVSFYVSLFSNSTMVPKDLGTTGPIYPLPIILKDRLVVKYQ